MKITTTLCPNNEYYAIDEDSYDGAPDGNNTQGWGKTELEAVQDLVWKLEDIEQKYRSKIEAKAFVDNLNSLLTNG